MIGASVIRPVDAESDGGALRRRFAFRHPPHWRDYSLRARFAVITAVAVAVAVVAVAVASLFIIRASLYATLDNQLRSYSTLAATATDAQEALAALNSGAPSVRGDEGDRPDLLQVQFVGAGGGVTSTTSSESDGLPVSTEAKQVAAGRLTSAIETIETDQGTYRVRTVAGSTGAVQVAENTGGIEDTLAQIALINLVLALAGVALASIVGWIAARAALRPVNTLIDGVERVTTTGDLGGRVPVRGTGEIADLATSFNDMLSALDTSRAAQHRLVEDAAHELRTPLTSLRNNVELLVYARLPANVDKKLTEQDHALLLRDISAQTEELTTLITEVVRLAKDEDVTEQADEVDLERVLRAVIERVRVGHPTGELALTSNPVIMRGRPAALDRALGNVVANAAKWSPPGASVSVELTRSATDAIVTVDDAGPGVDDVDLPHIFERFYRSASARARPGSGLGLAIVQQIVQAHHGVISAGRSDRGGALFTVTLPLNHPPGDRAPDADSVDS